MNALELMSRLGGETLNNKIRASIDGKIVILARMIGTEWEYTPEGQELANAHSNAAAEEVKPKRAKKTAEAAVEAEPTPEAPVAVESADVAPEL